MICGVIKMTQNKTSSSATARASPNLYEGTDKKVLFVCSAGILRSATAARIYGRKYNTRCAGTGMEYALIKLDTILMDWADEIVFVHPWTYDQAGFYFDLVPYKAKIKMLDIPDEYDHMAAPLIDAFEQQYEVLGMK